MSDPLYITVMWVALAVAGAFLLGFLVHARVWTRAQAREADRVLVDARREAEAVKRAAALEVREELLRERSRSDSEFQERRRELDRADWQLKEREAALERKVELHEKRERELARASEEFLARDKALRAKEARATQLIAEQNQRLERIAGLTAEEAKRELMANLEEQARLEASQYVKEIKEQARRTAEREAKAIVVSAIQRYGAELVVESTVSVVPLPGDEMKGRIIGREGRNIRSFEMATGVNVIIDDTPEAVILSSFDPIRREVARIALEKLVTDGRIHPGRIEDVVNKARKELDTLIQQAGEEAAYEAGVQRLHPELITLLGKLKYRTSYGQNVLQHLKESAAICGMMAAELHLDVGLARRAALLHDVGKALTHESEGTHVQLGVEVAQKYNEDPVVISAIAAHHDDAEHESVYSILVQAADAISGARPGARRETFETYIKRLEKLEEIAGSFEGVQKSYAIQAGREIRVIVEPTEVDDARIEILSSEIARRIERELEYPGHIKISVIRETRAVDYAR